jgi:polyphosphate glucokinase
MALYRRILAFDIGGTGLKASIVDARGRFLSKRERIPTPQPCPPETMLRLLAELAEPLGRYDCITIGFPGFVRKGVVHTAPNLGTEDWAGCPLESMVARKLGKPARLVNDADVQGLGAIKGEGLELVVTLGTGFGTAWFLDGALLPHLEFAHVPVHHGRDFDAYIGDRQRKKMGARQWNKRVKKTLEMLSVVFNYEHLYIGGGNAARIRFKLPPCASLVPNEDGMRGAAFVWVKRAAAARRAPGSGAKAGIRKAGAAHKARGKSSRPGKTRRPKA